MIPFFLGSLLLGAQAQGVVLLDGKPAEGVAVYAISEATRRSIVSSTTENGRFQIELPGSPENCVVAAIVGGRGETAKVQKGIPLRIEIPAGGSIAGSIDSVDQLASITLQPVDMPERGSAAWALNIVAGGSPSRAQNLAVGPPGAFSFAGLQPGKYRIFASSIGRSQVTELNVRPGENRLEIQLVPTGKLVGTVRFLDSERMFGDSMLYLRSSEQDYSIGIAVHGGRFSKDELVPGLYFASVHGPNMEKLTEEESVTIRSGESSALTLIAIDAPRP